MANEVRHLTDKEIDEFLNDLDHNNDGCIACDELEKKLDDVHKEIAPNPAAHHLHHEDRDEKARHEFLRSIMQTDKNRIPRAEFAKTIKSWEIPSMEQDKRQEQHDKEYFGKISLSRKLRAFWAVDGPQVVFLMLVIGLSLGLGIWQLIKYLTWPEFTPAFGWGVVVAKTSAGILYPIWFFLILSMSRHFATTMRKFYYISRFINWDLSQSFHIKISIAALFFSTLHALSHLTGTFVFGSQVQRQDAVNAVLGSSEVRRTYRSFLEERPGWTGLIALGLFYLLAGLSMPAIRKWSYEAFQLGHLLMFPIIGLLCAHGTAQLLQFSMLGYWLAFPTLLVIFERLLRIYNGFIKIPAELEVLDDDTIAINVTIPSSRIWKYRAGQYILLQVPQISFFQWHPFTISACVGNEMQVHIKTDGDWTGLVRKLGSDLKHVGVDGPFGAPAQRFYDFDQSIIVGSGIGVTPFSGILTDLQAHEEQATKRGASRSSRTSRMAQVTDIRRPRSRASSQTAIGSESEKTSPVRKEDVPEEAQHVARRGRSRQPAHHRRVDFHWIVKDKNYLLWFSDLLNALARPHNGSNTSGGLGPAQSPHLDLRIITHVTQKRKSISTHVFRWLLEMHRTEAHPESPLTGLINPTHFGRPDLARIMDEHYESMLESLNAKGEKGSASRSARRVGVFFCGAPVIGYELADRCQLLSIRGREDGSRLEYHFQMEVFN